MTTLSDGPKAQQRVVLEIRRGFARLFELVSPIRVRVESEGEARGGNGMERGTPSRRWFLCVVAAILLFPLLTTSVTAFIRKDGALYDLLDKRHTVAVWAFIPQVSDKYNLAHEALWKNLQTELVKQLVLSKRVRVFKRDPDDVLRFGLEQRIRSSVREARSKEGLDSDLQSAIEKQLQQEEKKEPPPTLKQQSRRPPKPEAPPLPESTTWKIWQTIYPAILRVISPYTSFYSSMLGFQDPIAEVIPPDYTIVLEIEEYQTSKSNDPEEPVFFRARGKVEYSHARRWELLEAIPISVSGTGIQSTSDAPTLRSPELRLAQLFAESGARKFLDRLPVRVLQVNGSGSQAWIDRGTDGGLSKGDYVDINREGKQLYDPTTGVEIGSTSGAVVGTAEVVEVKERVARIQRRLSPKGSESTRLEMGDRVKKKGQQMAKVRTPGVPGF